MRNVFFAVALMSLSSPVFAQDSMQKGDKSWTELEKQLADINAENSQWTASSATQNPNPKCKPNVTGVV